MIGSAGRRVRWAQAGVAALLVAPGVFLLAARSGAAQELGNYNGTVNATAVHLQAGSSAFPNFATGAVDNHYPLASVRFDSSPNAEAFSSPLDTGPLGQTAAGAGSQNQPQYADVRCPPQCDDKPVTVGSQPGPFSSSQATDKKAVAFGDSGGISSGGGAPAPPGGGGVPALPAPPPKSDGAALAAPALAPAAPASFPVLDAGRVAALRSALLAWRAQYLTVDDARRYPMPAAGTPDGVTGDTARSEARLDGSTLILDGTSSVGEVALGGGALALHGVNVHVTVSNDGTPKKTIAVNVGAAEVGGTPVTIGADGVSVNGQAVPGIGGAGAQASAALNQALGRAGLEVRSLAPAEKATDHQLSLDAVGVLIRFAPASPAPGVPAQFTAMALGEVFADSLAVPGEPGSGGLDDGLGGLGGDAGSVSTPADSGTAAGGPDQASAAAATEPAGSGFASDLGSSGSSSGGLGSSGSAFGSGSGAGLESGGGAALGPGGTSSSSSIGRTQLASPASARRLLGHAKPTKLLLLYLLWQSLVIGTVASLYLWRKADA